MCMGVLYLQPWSQEVAILQSKKEEAFLLSQEKVKEPQTIQKPLQVGLFHCCSHCIYYCPSPSTAPREEVTSLGPVPTLSLHPVDLRAVPYLIPDLDPLNDELILSTIIFIHNDNYYYVLSFLHYLH